MQLAPRVRAHSLLELRQQGASGGLSCEMPLARAGLLAHGRMLGHAAGGHADDGAACEVRQVGRGSAGACSMRC